MEPKIAETRWDKQLEKPIYEEWKKSRIYRFNDKTKKPIYSIDTPPPYVNAPVHIGQATTYVLMDMFARFRRMTGFEVLFPLGLDRNGLPIEMAAEKRFNVNPHEVSREMFLELCRKVLEESSIASIDTFLRSGIGFNSWKIGTTIGDVYLTDSGDYRKLTQETFIDLWNKGLIYEDERVTNYCPGCKTTIADAEVEYENKPTVFNDVVFMVKETGEKIIIGTTRPELICTCGMVIFNPNDKRYRHLEGKTAITPIFEKEVPIKPHPMAEIDKGTGLVMMCSAGDLSDIRFFREMKIEPVIAIDGNGKMNKNAGFMEGLLVKDARKKIIDELKNRDLLVNQTKMIHRTPICERSKDEIEFISMRELYLKQIIYKKKMLEFSKKMNFFEPKSRQIMNDWIKSISIDWPISRRRYYATEVPLWYCEKCSKIIVPPKGKYYKPWKEGPPVGKCPKCGSSEFRGDDRVFDTWFDSSISPLYILMYSRDGKFFNKNIPCSLRPQGKEIIRTWLYYTVLKSYLLADKTIFRDVWINYHIVDENGKKMSKSKGNIIDPKDVLDRFGAEPFRLWSVVEGNLTKTDFRCSFERIQGTEKTLTKLWNVARFISSFSVPKKKPKLTELDSWIISETNNLADFSRKQYEKYDFHSPVAKIKNFLWETFASHYMELVKSRAYNNDSKFSKEEQESALYTLNYCLDTILKLLAPVIPLITYKIYMDLRGIDIHFETFPEPEKAGKQKFSATELIFLNGKIWKAKKDKSLSLKDGVKSATINQKFNGIEKDLKETHKIGKIKYGNNFLVEF
jgi:valyl-tRNA synthetase